MKKFLRPAVATVLLLSLCLSCVLGVSAVNANPYASMFRIRLHGIVHPDDGDRTSWQTTAEKALNRIPGSSITKYTAFTNNQALTNLKTSEMFVIQTHGSQISFLAVDASGKQSTVFRRDIDNLTTSALSNLKLAFIGACNCGEGGMSGPNIVNAIFQKEARCVIGYTKSVSTKANNLMIKYFCEAIGNGYTISAALSYADSLVLSKYGSSGETNSRLVRGDTSVKFVETGLLLGGNEINAKSSIPSNEIVYLTADDGTVYGFFDPTKLTTTNDIGVATAAMQPDEAGLYQFDTGKYALSDQYYTEDSGLWTTIYNYAINGIPTTDSIVFVHNTSGDLVSYFHSNEGVFDNIVLSTPLLAAKEAELAALLVQAGIEDYTIVETRLVVDESGSVALRYSIDYMVENDMGSFSTIDDFIISVED